MRLYGAFAITLLALADLACTKTVGVVRVGFDCPLVGGDAGGEYLPFGRRLQAVYPRFGKATSVEVLDGGKALGKLPAACVAATAPPTRRLHVREMSTSLYGNQAEASTPKRHHVQEGNYPSYVFETKHDLESDLDLRLQPGQAAEVFGDGDSVIVVKDGIPLGITPAYFLTADAEAYFAAHYDEYARNPRRQTRGLSSAKTLERRLLTSPRVAQSILRAVTARVQEGDWWAVRWQLESVRERLDDLPELRGIACDLGDPSLREVLGASCKPEEWALVADPDGEGADLDAQADGLRATLRWPLYPFWRDQQTEAPFVVSGAEVKGLAADHPSLLFAVCSESRAKAWRELLAPFVKGLRLERVQGAAERFRCPASAARDAIGYFENDQKLVLYREDVVIHGVVMHNQLLAMVFDTKGKVVTGWYPRKAFDLGDFDGAEERVRCTFHVNRDDPFAVPAHCQNYQPEVGKEQSGTIIFAMKKGRFTALAKPKGKPKPIPENGD